MILELRAISYAYDGRIGASTSGPRHLALEGVDLALHAGERIALLGGNGAGKSTLVQVLDGLLEPRSGEILVRGKSLPPGPKREEVLLSMVGLVFQDPDDQILAPTVAREVAFGPANIGWDQDKIRQSVEDALERAGLAGFGPVAPHRLSHGQKKRVCIASVLAMDPAVLALDEPTAGLDPRAEAALLADLSELCSLGRTVLLSTHDVDLAWEWASRVVVLEEGRVVADGPAVEVLRDVVSLERWGLRGPRALRRESGAKGASGATARRESDLFLRLAAATAGFRTSLEEALGGLKWDAAGLLPVVAQDAETGRVVMLAWCDRESLRETLRTRRACFWSRSRQRLWRKGETSGNVLDLVEIQVDCDGDALLFRVRPRGPVCHTGRPDCFYHELSSEGLATLVSPP